METVKILALTNNLILITQIEEVESELGGPDCKLIKPYVVDDKQELTPFLGEYTSQETFMISSDKIVTLVDPKPTLLEKYQNTIK